MPLRHRMMNISNIVYLRRIIALTAFTLTMFCSGSVNAAVVDVDLPSCMPLSRAITVDGKLDDWQGIVETRYMPLKAFGSGDMAGERRDIGANVRFAYDAAGLCLAVDWLSPLPPTNTAIAAAPVGWQEHGDGLELHIEVDGVVSHVLSFPSAGGKPVLLLRRGESTVWRDISADGGSAAIAVTTPGTHYGQELRIPWKSLSRSGAAPAGKRVRLMLDLAWKDIPGSAIAKMGEGIRLNDTNVTYNILTSAEKIFSHGYLPSSSDWGELTFAEKPAAPSTEEHPLGAGITGMTASRAGKAPVIDGVISPEEWPAASLADTAFASAYLGDRLACRLGARYDGDNLYLVGHFASPVPPLNTEPEHEQLGFKGGDCLQVRLARGSKAISFCVWCDSINKRPALTVDGKDLPNIFLLTQGAKLAFKPDTGGYTMEMSIPWKAIFPGSTAPAIGEKMRCTFQPWWSGIDARFTLAGEMRLEKRGPLAVHYTMPRDAEVSIGVFTNAGELLRWLTRSDFRRAGANTEFWDGRDQDGKLIPAGSYQVKALYHDPLTTEYLMSVGNPGTPPWPSADGKGDWLGDESNPQAAATDGKWVFLASPGSEKGLSVIAIDERGQRQWAVGSDLYPRSVALAAQGDYLYVLYSGPEMTDNSGIFTGKNAQGRAVLRCFDKRTGQAARFTTAKPTLKIATFPYIENMVGLWDFWNNKSFDPDTYGGLPRYADSDFGEVSEAMGVAATSTTVYVAMHTQNRLLAFDAVTAEARPDLDIAIDKPVSLLALTDQVMLAVSGKKVVRIDLKTKNITPFITAGLAAPFGLANDKFGNIYVSDWRNSFQVKVFSPAGALVRAIGKPGGRAFIGPWEANGMLVPRGIAVTDAGELWVAEDDSTPRRVSVWNSRSGALIKDYIGPTAYGGGSAIWFEPGDPTIMHTMGCKFKLDLQKKTWNPLAIETRRLSKDQPFALNGARWGDATRVLKHGKDEFLVVCDDTYRMVFLQHKGDSWVPAAALGCVHRWSTDDGTGRKIWDSDLYSHMIKGMYPDCFRGHVGDNYAWCDKNGDGLVQTEEMVWTKTIFRGDTYQPGQQMEFGIGWGEVPTPDWIVPFGGECKVAGGGNRVLFTVKPRGWAASGAPIFDMSDSKMFATSSDQESLYGDTKGHIFSTGSEGDKPDPITCYDAVTGKRLWRVAGTAKQGAKDVRFTNVNGEYDIPGLGHMVCGWQWHGNWRPYIVTTDGLYVGSPQEDGKLGPAGMWDESFRYFFQMPDGTPLMINGANDAQHLLKIKGLEKGGRFASSLTITAADAQIAAKSTPDAVAAEPIEVQTPLAMTWLDKASEIDGSLSDWEMGRGAVIDAGQGRKATVSMGRDATTLYLAYHVNEDKPLRNQGANWQTLFLTGDCVDLMLATDPNADPHRGSAVAGDLRLLMGEFQNKPIAVLYRPVVPGTKQKVQLMAAQIDRIDKLTDAKVAVRRGEGFYELEAAIPLASLGVAPNISGALRGDVGVIYADATGRDRAVRSYHFNRKTGMTADLTTEATLQPAEWGTIILPLGKNLLKNGGFESGFSDSMDTGWKAEQNNGMRASLSSEAAHSGRRGLLVRQIDPVVFPETAFIAPDYGDFVKAANGGKGGGEVVLRQRVPVTAGKRYSLRFYHRAEGMKGGEEKAPGKKRGYSTVSPWIGWEGGKGGHNWMANMQNDTIGWNETYNTETNNYGVPKPYTAPEGATSAVLTIYFTCLAPEITPTFCLDDVEFVELP